MLRGLVDATEDEQRERIEEIRTVLDSFDEAPWSLGLTVFELDTGAGYAAWAPTYDGVDNALITAEQPVIEEIVSEVAPGRALDAACGTGRHSRHLASRHEVVGIDASPEMLAIAAEAVPAATFARGDLNALGFPDDSFDLVVCSLALTHVRDISRPIGEFARVVRPGGRVVLSDIHPMNVLILGQAFFTDERGDFAFVRNHVHPIASYVDAFNRSGLVIRRCAEPVADGSAGGPAADVIPQASERAVGGLPFALIWDLEKPAA